MCPEWHSKSLWFLTGGDCAKSLNDALVSHEALWKKFFLGLIIYLSAKVLLPELSSYDSRGRKVWVNSIINIYNSTGLRWEIPMCAQEFLLILRIPKWRVLLLWHILAGAHNRTLAWLHQHFLPVSSWPVTDNRIIKFWFSLRLCNQMPLSENFRLSF